jgi:hypothetical protein
MLTVIGRTAGLVWWQCLLIFFSALALDGDIAINEFWRWLNGQKPRLLTLDEWSYQHKFLGHQPLIVLPASFLLGWLFGGIMFGILECGAFLLHLIYDTVDKNFDGVRWLWPINSISYKLRWGKEGLIMEKKSPERLSVEAAILAKKSRKSKRILKDNIL